MKRDRQKLYEQLRKKHPSFIYEGFSYALDNSKLHIVFEFSQENGPVFLPRIVIPVPRSSGPEILSDSLIRNMIFNMGMVELISYWKAACPPLVKIRAMGLEEQQIAWWKKLYLHGLGEFFYENGIRPGNDFMHIEDEAEYSFRREDRTGGSGVLVPLGGGKDSVVSLEILKDEYDCRPFIINPREASLQSAYLAGFSDDEIIKVQRTIDPQLLEMNEQGYLNGHTPFSAMLAFTSLLTASLHGLGEIALSNESSANEPSIPGTSINHQYSKSLEFEKDFRNYVDRYITSGIQYYSFLRPLNELQIGGLFSSFRHHFSTFRSCNTGSKTNSWCGNCPKCLFTYIMLGAFLDTPDMSLIFGEDLLDKESLAESFDQLCGFTDEKPFECVGTIAEVRVALKKIIDDRNGKNPFLLSRFIQFAEDWEFIPDEFTLLLKDFQEHCIPDNSKVEHLKEKIRAL